VPQQAQLFPWKTLAENVELPLLLRGVATAERRQRVASAIEAVGLSGFEHYFPGQLSGGMQKRGSIARTLVYRPDVILMDEPFGALDAQTRMVMQDDLQTLSGTQMCIAGNRQAFRQSHKGRARDPRRRGMRRAFPIDDIQETGPSRIRDFRTRHHICPEAVCVEG
jgi:ABC-type ATPase involved in cell division